MGFDLGLVFVSNKNELKVSEVRSYWVLLKYPYQTRMN